MNIHSSIIVKIYHNEVMSNPFHKKFGQGTHSPKKMDEKMRFFIQIPSKSHPRAKKRPPQRFRVKVSQLLNRLQVREVYIFILLIQYLLRVFLCNSPPEFRWA
jgi:hypothetical protein